MTRLAGLPTLVSVPVPGRAAHSARPRRRMAGTAARGHGRRGDGRAGAARRRPQPEEATGLATRGRRRRAPDGVAPRHRSRVARVADRPDRDAAILPRTPRPGISARRCPRAVAGGPCRLFPRSARRTAPELSDDEVERLRALLDESDSPCAGTSSWSSRSQGSCRDLSRDRRRRAVLGGPLGDPEAWPARSRSTWTSAVGTRGPRDHGLLGTGHASASRTWRSRRSRRRHGNLHPRRPRQARCPPSRLTHQTSRLHRPQGGRPASCRAGRTPHPGRHLHLDGTGTDGATQVRSWSPPSTRVAFAACFIFPWVRKSSRWTSCAATGRQRAELLLRTPAQHVSLNFAAFRAVLEQGQRIGAGPSARTLRFFSRWIQTLYRFNAKCQPRWVPRATWRPPRPPQRRNRRP